MKSTAAIAAIACAVALPAAAMEQSIVVSADQIGAERDQKLSRERMSAEGVGPFAPVAPNDAEAGRVKNLRVEMVLR